MTIGVIYKCRCMSAEATVQVRARADGEDVSEWMIELQRALAIDHNLRSPTCIAPTVEYAKIPLEENNPVGAKPRLHS